MIPVAIAAKLLPIRAALAKVPRVVWLALAAVLVLWAGWTWHKRTVSAADRAGFERGVTTTQAAYRKALAAARVTAMKRRAQQEARAAAITKELNDEQDRLRARIAADARALQLRGPGKAGLGPRCVDHPGVPAGAGQATVAERDADAARTGVPSTDWAAVPWGWLTRRAEGHDALLSYMLADQKWHREQAAAWEKGRK